MVRCELEIDGKVVFACRVPVARLAKIIDRYCRWGKVSKLPWAVFIYRSSKIRGWAKVDIPTKYLDRILTLHWKLRELKRDSGAAVEKVNKDV